MTNQLLILLKSLTFSMTASLTHLNYYYPANNAMQGPCGPCKGFPYGNRTDLAAGAAVAPHGFIARVSCDSNYLCKMFLFKNN